MCGTTWLVTSQTVVMHWKFEKYVIFGLQETLYPLKLKKKTKSFRFERVEMNTSFLSIL